MSWRLWIALAAPAVALTLTSPAAIAQVRNHFFHGSVCQPTNASRDRVEYDQWGAANISSSQTASIRCQLPLDTDTRFVPEKVTSIIVTVFDRNGSSDVSCVAKAVNSSGGVVWSQSLPSAGSGTPSQRLTFTPNPPPFTTESFLLSCDLPPVASGWRSHVTQVMVETEFF